MSKPIKVSEKNPDYKSLLPLFGWFPIDTIKHIFQIITQYACAAISDTLKKHYKLSFPALNIKRRDEYVAVDTVYSDTLAIDDGCK